MLKFERLRWTARLASAAALAAAVALAAPTETVAQASCADPSATCAAALGPGCKGLFDGTASQAELPALQRECGPLLSTYRECLMSELERCAGGGAAAAPAPATRSATRGLTFDAPTDVKLVALRREDPDPSGAVFYGYVVIGASTTPAHKAAVARALACRLSAAIGDERTTLTDGGAVIVPTIEQWEAEVVSPGEMLDFYDFPRAGKWIQTLMRTAGEGGWEDDGVLFVGALHPLSEELDAPGALPDLSPPGPYVIADASALSPRYLERWMYELVRGIRDGRVQGRADMQDLMEVHSWIESIGEPLAAVMRFAESAEAAAPERPNCV